MNRSSRTARSAATRAFAASGAALLALTLLGGGPGAAAHPSDTALLGSGSGGTAVPAGRTGHPGPGCDAACPELRP